MKKLLSLYLLSVMIVCSSCSNVTESADISGKYYADIVIRDYGTIVVEIDADAAPITAANFIGLVRDGFYDGLTFHRIDEGFMMQGGDPDGDGTYRSVDSQGDGWT